MAANLITDPDAEADVSEAYDWYEQQRVGLGEDFLAAVDDAIAAVCRSPKIRRVVFKTYRRTLTRRFPYAVYYGYDDGTDTVTVYVVIHTSRDPKVWQNRLP